MLQTFKNAWKIPDLRNRLLFTIFIIVLFRIGSVIPVPYVNAEMMNQSLSSGGSLFSYFNLLSGEAFSKATLFALSISPYITASIVIQLLTIAIPALERLSKDGENGRKVLTSITRYATVGLGLVTAYGYYTLLRSWNLLTDTGVFPAIVIVACYSAGASLIMWLAEQINENGIGNGISIVLLANIVASFPGMLMNVNNSAGANSSGLVTVITVAAFIVLFVCMVLYVVYISDAERRLPVQYAKRQVGRKMYGGQNTTLPIKLNMSGVMPIIFASSIVSIPTTLALIFPPETGSIWDKITGAFSSTSWLYVVLFFILIVLFAYFYLAISFNPIEVANNLKKNGGFIPGIRPGKPTSDYITKILNKVTLIGSLALALLACVPLVIGIVNQNFAGLAFSGSSIIIVVGVISETAKEIEAQMTMRHYKGFLE